MGTGHPTRKGVNQAANNIPVKPVLTSPSSKAVQAKIHDQLPFHYQQNTDARAGQWFDPPTLRQQVRLRPQSLSPANVLQLQRLVGNRATSRRLGQGSVAPAAAIGGTPMVQRKTNPDLLKAYRYLTWRELNPEQQSVLTRVTLGQNLSEVAVQLKLDMETVQSHWEKIITTARKAFKAKPDETVDENWIRNNFTGYFQIKAAAVELRDMQPGSGAAGYTPQSQDTSFTTLDGQKWTFDNFDYTLVIELPDGTGYQVTYVFPKTAPGESPKGKATKVVPLSRRRIKALAEMGLKQGTFQESESERESRLKISPTPTLCNAWPVNIGKAVATVEAEDTVEEGEVDAARQRTGLSDLQAGAVLNERSSISHLEERTVEEKDGETIKYKKVMVDVGKTSDLNHLNPEGDARKYGAWRTWADTPEGPKPGDIYSFWEAGVVWPKGTPAADQIPANMEKASITRNAASNKHIGVFKSRRPNPDGKTETWTVVDGGQGMRQEVRERNRTFHIATQIFTTQTADGGQKADARWMSGWLDLDAYFTNPETGSTKADYEKWKTDTDSGKKGTRQQGAAEIKGELWPEEVELTGAPPQEQADDALYDE